MPDVVKIQVLGLSDFRRQLKVANAQLPRELRKVFNTAARAVISDAVPRMPERTGKLKRSVRGRSTQTEGRVVSGTPTRVPYAGFIEFGGRVGKGRTGPGTGSVRRPFVKGGRYLYPAFVRRQGEVLVAMENALRELAKTMEN